MPKPTPTPAPKKLQEHCNSLITNTPPHQNKVKSSYRGFCALAVCALMGAGFFLSCAKEADVSAPFGKSSHTPPIVFDTTWSATDTVYFASRSDAEAANQQPVSVGKHTKDTRDGRSLSKRN